MTRRNGRTSKQTAPEESRVQTVEMPEYSDPMGEAESKEGESGASQGEKLATALKAEEDSDVIVEASEGEKSPEERVARLEKEVEELQARNEELARTVENERNEKELYRRVAALAESNELLLHRKLSPYVEGETTRLRARNEALEKALKGNEAEQDTRNRT